MANHRQQQHGDQAQQGHGRHAEDHILLLSLDHGRRGDDGRAAANRRAHSQQSAELGRQFHPTCQQQQQTQGNHGFQGAQRQSVRADFQKVAEMQPRSQQNDAEGQDLLDRELDSGMEGFWHRPEIAHDHAEEDRDHHGFDRMYHTTAPGPDGERPERSLGYHQSEKREAKRNRETQEERVPPLGRDGFLGGQRENVRAASLHVVQVRGPGIIASAFRSCGCALNKPSPMEGQFNNEGDRHCHSA